MLQNSNTSWLDENFDLNLRANRSAKPQVQVLVQSRFSRFSHFYFLVHLMRIISLKSYSQGRTVQGRTVQGRTVQGRILKVVFFEVAFCKVYCFAHLLQETNDLHAGRVKCAKYRGLCRFISLHGQICDL